MLLPAENIMSLLNYRVLAALSATGLTQCQVNGELRISSGDRVRQWKVITDFNISNDDGATNTMYSDW